MDFLQDTCPLGAMGPKFEHFQEHQGTASLENRHLRKVYFGVSSYIDGSRGNGFLIYDSAFSGQ